MDAVAGRPATTVRHGRRRPHIDDICGGSLKKVAECAICRRFDGHIVESLHHILHPRIPLRWPDLEAEMRFAEAQPPPALRVLRRGPQELSQERGERFDGALE